MWPSTPFDVLMGKLDAIRDLARIAYASEGANRSRLFATARDMLGEISDLIKEEAPAPIVTEEDD